MHHRHGGVVEPEVFPGDLASGVTFGNKVSGQVVVVDRVAGTGASGGLAYALTKGVDPVGGIASGTGAASESAATVVAVGDAAISSDTAVGVVGERLRGVGKTL